MRLDDVACVFTILFSEQLSMWRCNDELNARAQEIHKQSKSDAKHYIGMPFFALNVWIVRLNLVEVRWNDSNKYIRPDAFLFFLLILFCFPFLFSFYPFFY